jgi:hypothetical protein
MVSAEALALISYFGRHRAPTHVIGGAASVPPQLVSSVLKESELLRRENEERVKDEVTLRVASSALLAECALAVVGATVVLGLVLATKTTLGLPWVIGTCTALWTVATLAVMAGLNHVRLLPLWSKQLPSLIGDGISGLRTRFVEAASRDDRSRPNRNDRS